MKYRKLPIAWTVAWGAVAALLLVLWVRSYAWLDDISYVGVNTRPFLVQSNSGSLYVGWYGNWIRPAGWQRRTLGHAPRRAVFGAAFSSVEVSMRCPYWFLMPAVAVLAAIPWAHQHRWRFSLRTLLIATAVTSMLVGGMVAYDRAMVAADRVAIKEAYLAGRISLDAARDYTDEDVDRWPKPTETNSP